MKRKEVVLMGDFNGRVGKSKKSNVVGEHGEEVKNDNGTRLIEMSEQHELKITNGFFQHREQHKYTWTQPTKKQKSIIDYLIIKQNSPIETLDVWVQRGASCSSDHFLVRAKLCLGYKYRKTKTETEQTMKYLQWPKYNLESLQNESTVFLYKLRLSQKLTEVLNGNTEQKYNILKECIDQAAKEALGQKEEKGNKRIIDVWWSEDLEKLITDKKKAYQKWLSTGDTKDRKAYMRNNYIVKNEVKNQKMNTGRKDALK